MKNTNDEKGTLNRTDKKKWYIVILVCCPRSILRSSFSAI